MHIIDDRNNSLHIQSKLMPATYQQPKCSIKIVTITCDMNMIVTISKKKIIVADNKTGNGVNMSPSFVVVWLL